MKNIFTAKNFQDRFDHKILDWNTAFDELAEFSNAHFRNWVYANSLIVHGSYNPDFTNGNKWTVFGEITHSAYLIDIEPIIKCEHPDKKIKYNLITNGVDSIVNAFSCECGAKLRPTAYEEIK